MIRTFEQNGSAVDDAWLDEKERSRLNELKNSDADVYLNQVKADIEQIARLQQPLSSQALVSREVLQQNEALGHCENFEQRSAEVNTMKANLFDRLSQGMILPNGKPASQLIRQSEAQSSLLGKVTQLLK